MKTKKVLLTFMMAAALISACKKDEISSGLGSNHRTARNAAALSTDEPGYFGDGVYLLVYDDNGNIISPDYQFLEAHPAIVNAFNIAVSNTPGVYVNLGNSRMNTANGFNGVPMGFESQGTGTLLPLEPTSAFTWPVPASVSDNNYLNIPYSSSGPASGNEMPVFKGSVMIRQTGRADLDNVDLKSIGWTEGDHAHSWPHRHKKKNGFNLENPTDQSIGWTEGDHIRIRKYYGLPDGGSATANSIGWTEGDHIRIRKEAFNTSDGDAWVLSIDEAQKSAPHLYFSQYFPQQIKVYSANNKTYYPIAFDYSGKVISSSISSAPVGSYIQNLLSDAGGLQIFTGTFTVNINSNGYTVSNTAVWNNLPVGFKSDAERVIGVIKENLNNGETMHLSISDSKTISYSMTDASGNAMAFNVNASYNTVNQKSGNYWYLPVIGTLPEALITAADQKGWL